MRDKFERKVPSMRDEFKYFYPSMRDFCGFPQFPIIKSAKMALSLKSGAWYIIV